MHSISKLYITNISDRMRVQQQHFDYIQLINFFKLLPVLMFLCQFLCFILIPSNQIRTVNNMGLAVL